MNDALDDLAFEYAREAEQENPVSWADIDEREEERAWLE